jgi:2-hydroxy-3-keto-5-methylthiopentenyl-1-phosphate phosphatase
MTTDDRRQAGPAPAGPLRRFLAFLDYDGTATTRECNEVVLQSLVGDAWRPFEDEVRAGRMSHAVCFDRQIGLVRAPRAELLGAMGAAAEPAPGLADFLAAVQDGGGRAAVVSAGFAEVVATFWRRHELPPVDLAASGLAGDGPGGGPPYRVLYSPRLGDCPRCGPGACKAAVLRELRRPGDRVWVFGDGASDLCPAREADLVFARGHLAERCAAEGLPWRPLDFAAAQAALPRATGVRASAPPEVPA